MSVSVLSDSVNVCEYACVSMFSLSVSLPLYPPQHSRLSLSLCKCVGVLVCSLSYTTLLASLTAMTLSGCACVLCVCYVCCVCVCALEGGETRERSTGGL